MFIIDETQLADSLNHLVEMAARGQATVITRDNQPIAVLAPYDGRLSPVNRPASATNDRGGR